MKCLEKDRTRRIETANGLARDVERFLNGDPVEACPPSASYRLQKFARKHHRFLTTAVAFLVVLGAATLMSTWQALRAMQAEASTRQTSPGRRKKKRGRKSQMASRARTGFFSGQHSGGDTPRGARRRSGKGLDDPPRHRRGRAEDRRVVPEPAHGRGIDSQDNWADLPVPRRAGAGNFPA